MVEAIKNIWYTKLSLKKHLHSSQNYLKKSSFKAGRITLRASPFPFRILQASPFQAERSYRHHHSRQNDHTGITIPGRMILQASPFQAERSYRHHCSRQNDLRGITIPGRMILQASPLPGRITLQLSPFQASPLQVE